MGDIGRLLQAIDRIPAGRVVGIGTLAAAVGVDRRLAKSLLQQLTPEQRALHPWHRVVEDGGAIGRHPWREHQIDRLRAEGIPVAPAGIVRSWQNAGSSISTIRRRHSRRQAGRSLGPRGREE
ncbi:MAG TPA: MGMT family protein [Hyphomicrobiaceae bacterium]|nr:MGMT family protein [Hyphomicrobiaceae bacterium]